MGNILLYKQKSEVLTAFARLNIAQAYLADRLKQLLLVESILYSLVVKHSYEIKKKYPTFLAFQLI